LLLKRYRLASASGPLTDSVFPHGSYRYLATTSWFVLANVVSAYRKALDVFTLNVCTNAWFVR
jgi:hypothetical protein